MEYLILNENKGIGKNSGQPFHMIKLADPVTFENHTCSVDPAYVNEPFNLPSGQLVEVTGRLSTPYQNTGFIIHSLKPKQKA